MFSLNSYHAIWTFLDNKKDRILKPETKQIEDRDEYNRKRAW